MTKKFKQLFTMLLAVAILVTGLPAMEAKAKEGLCGICVNCGHSGESHVGLCSDCYDADEGACEESSNYVACVLDSGHDFDFHTAIPVQICYCTNKNHKLHEFVVGIDSDYGYVYTYLGNKYDKYNKYDYTTLQTYYGTNVIEGAWYFYGPQCGRCYSAATPTTPCETPSGSEVAAAPTIPTDYVAERVAEEEAMEVSPVTIDKAQYGAGEAAVVPATSYNLSKFVTTKGIVKGIKTAVEAANNNKKDVAEIYTGKPFCFNKEIIKAIQEGNKTVVYYFAHEGHIYSVTVPATVDAAKVLEQAGFAGPLYVGQQLGTTKLIK